MSNLNFTHEKTSADCGQRLESTAHEAGRITAEALAKAHEDAALGDASAFHANQKPYHGFNETSYEMKDKLCPLDSPIKHKFSEYDCSHEQATADCGQRLESVAHEEGRKAAAAIARSKEAVTHGSPSASHAHERPAYQFNESSDDMKDKMNPLDPPKHHGRCGTK